MLDELSLQLNDTRSRKKILHNELLWSRRMIAYRMNKRKQNGKKKIEDET